MTRSVHPRDSPLWIGQSQLLRDLNYILAILQKLIMGLIFHHVHKLCSQSRGEGYIVCVPPKGGQIIFSLPTVSLYAFSLVSFPSSPSKASRPKVAWLTGGNQ